VWTLLKKHVNFTEKEQCSSKCKTERNKQTRKETSSHTHEPTTVLKLAQAGLAK
jgi:hypothetical protein